MKTIGVDKYGGSDVSRVASVRIPEPAPGHGSVMDNAASINLSKANAAFATGNRVRLLRSVDVVGEAAGPPVGAVGTVTDAYARNVPSNRFWIVWFDDFVGRFPNFLPGEWLVGTEEIGTLP